ncbi:unnamed protein product [Peniophora sp. CBMAI 1063]|nr:unnamed protein product [Peniophora sp. CBMAI 1063]
MLATPTIPHSHFGQSQPFGALPMPMAPRALPVSRSATLPAPTPIPFHPAQAQTQRSSGVIVLHPKPQPQVIHPLPARALPAHVLPASHTASSPIHPLPAHHSPASAHLHTSQVIPVPTPRVPDDGVRRLSHRAPVMAHASSMSALHHSSKTHPLPIPPVGKLAVQSPPASAHPLRDVPPPLLIPLPPIPASTNNIVSVAHPQPTVPLSAPYPNSPAIPATNEVPLTPTSLTHALNTLSDLLLPHFGHQVRLLVHGGVVAVLHKDLRHRRETRDVDYVHRAFENDYRAACGGRAGDVLRNAIRETAQRCGLGADWCNSGPDVALPLASDNMQRTYDPIATSSTTLSTDTDEREVFAAPGLRLVAVDWAWALALKFVRYAKHDPDDVCALLRMLYWKKQRSFTPSHLEQWITTACWPMGYDRYPAPARAELSDRIEDALARAYGPEWAARRREHAREKQRRRSKSRSR